MNVSMDVLPAHIGLAALTEALSVEVTVITVLSIVTHPFRAT